MERNINLKINAEDFKKRLNIKDGKDYILTEKDRKEIAKSIDVPVVEKVIEKTEVIKEKTNEVAKYETPLQIAEKLNTLTKKVDWKVLKNVPDMPKGGGSANLIVSDEGGKEYVAKRLNFAGAGVTLVSVGNDTFVVTIPGGGSSQTVYTEKPTGDIDGVNLIYTTLHDINNIFSFAANGQFIHTEEYTISGNQITFISPLASDLAGTNFTIIYQ